MFLQQNGLVDPMEVPLPIGLSWVTRLKTDIYKKNLAFLKAQRFESGAQTPTIFWCEKNYEKSFQK